MSIEGQGHFFTIYFPGFVCFVLYKATISSERLQDHWSSGLRLAKIAHGGSFKNRLFHLFTNETTKSTFNTDNLFLDVVLIQNLENVFLMAQICSLHHQDERARIRK